MPSFSLFDLFWIFLIIISLQPLLQRYRLQMQRLRCIRQLERARGSRLITLIHRQETMSLLGFPVMRFIDMDDSEQVLRAIKLTDPQVPIDLVLHTPGGLVLAAEQIAFALARRPGKVTVFVPHYAMSGGTLIALAADELVMDENAVLGPVDPQVGQYPAASILQAVQAKDVNEVDDQTLILADIARKALQQMKGTVAELLAQRLSADEAERVATILTSGTWTHDYPITVDQARELGLQVRTDLPPEVYQLMELYPQAGAGRPSVEYIPVPYAPPPTRPGRRPLGRDQR
jgi:ClpP class serine protease